VSLKATLFVSLLVVGGVDTHAQIPGAVAGEVAIVLREGQADYCLDFQGRGRNSTPRPSDIMLRLPVRLRYQNHRSDTIYLPHAYQWLWRMLVPGQNEPTILRNARIGAPDVKSLLALSRPEAGPFWVIAGEKDASTTAPNLSVLKYKDTVEDNDTVLIPVLDRSSGLDLRGKTVQIAMTRDFRSIPPNVVETLNEKWKDYGIVWAQVVESDTLTLRIPEQPLTRNCNSPTKIN